MTAPASQSGGALGYDHRPAWPSRTAVAALATVVVGLTGCEGGGLTRGDLMNRVSRICAQAKRATNSYNDPRFRDPSSVARYLATVTQIANWRLQQFNRLRPSGDVSFWASDASDWGTFVGRATVATQAMALIAKRSRREARTRTAGRDTYDLFYAVDDEIGAAADNVTNAPQGIPACYS
jgi:hypothetical protein